MGRIIAIDYGTRRTGIAVSDPLQLIAGGLATVETRELERYLTQYIAREDVSVIVVGKPLKMNGAPSETMRFVLPLVARLHRTYPSIEVVLYDERFTSAIAHRAMLDGGLRKMARRNRALVDKISATIILAAPNNTDNPAAATTTPAEEKYRTISLSRAQSGSLELPRRKTTMEKERITP